jgi:hypothetical protein
MSKLRYRHERVPILAAVLAGIVSLLVAPSPAAANRYHDFLCRVPYGPGAGRAASADGVTYATNGGFFYAGDGCEGGGSLYAQMIGETTHPFGTGSWDTFTAPAGLSIAGFTLWRYEADGPSQPYGSPASNLARPPSRACAQTDALAVRRTIRWTRRTRSASAVSAALRRFSGAPHAAADLVARAWHPGRRGADRSPPSTMSMRQTSTSSITPRRALAVSAVRSSRAARWTGSRRSPSTRATVNRAYTAARSSWTAIPSSRRS